MASGGIKAAWTQTARRFWAAPIRAAALTLAILSLAPAGAADARQAVADDLGLTLADVTPQTMAAEGLMAPYGALVAETAPGSPGAEKLAPGDLIISAGGAPVLSAEDLKRALAALEAGESLPLTGFRGREALSLALTRPEPAATADAAALDGLAADPLPVIDSGGHTALIRDIILHPDGRRLISAGDDKTVRIWDLEKKSLIRVIRGPSAPGTPGKLYAMALSPDGETLALGGFLAENGEVERDSVRLIDLKTGEITGLLLGHRDVIADLAFSRDGKKLISGSADYTAIVWDVAQRRIISRLNGHRHAIYGVGFTADGARAVTASYDQTLRLWDAKTGEVIKELIGHEEKVRSLAIAPDGTIASGDKAGAIILWDGATGESKGVFAKPGGWVGSLAFSTDGAKLLATCSQADCLGLQTVYEVATGRQLHRFAGHTNTVLAAAWLDGERLATGGGSDNEIHIWRARTGKIEHTLRGQGRRIWGTGFSADGGRVGWGYRVRRSLNVLGDVDTAIALGDPSAEDRLQDGPTPLSPLDAQSFHRAILALDGRSLRHQPGGGFGYSSGQLVIEDKGGVRAVITRGSTDGYRHSAYSFSPDGARVISGGIGGQLLAYDLDGKTLGRYVGHEGDIWAVTPSPDGRLLATSGDDQTVRLWNLETFELILTIFPGADGSWIAFTPQGYYDASNRPDGAGRIGWLLNYGPTKNPGFVTAEQLGDRLYRPGLIARAIELASAKSAIAEANARRAEDQSGDPLPANLRQLLSALPPRLRLGEPEERDCPIYDVCAEQGGWAVIAPILRLNGSTLEALEVTVAARRPDGSVERRSVQPIPLAEAAPPARVLARNDLREGEILRRYRIPIFRGDNEITLVARTGAGRSLARDTQLSYAAEGRLDRGGRLRILAVGVNITPKAKAYAPLRYAAKDARAFAEEAAQVMRPGHVGEPEIRVLGPEPTLTDIDAALDWFDDAADGDTSILFMAGHGRAEGGGDEYYFLTADAELTDNNALRGALHWRALQRRLTDMAGRKLLFLDACRSSEGYNPTLKAGAQLSETVMFSSTSAGQRAIESPEYKHGLFTYALLQGMRSEAWRRGELYSTRLGTTVQEMVDELSAGEQLPFTAHSSDVSRVLLAKK